MIKFDSRDMCLQVSLYCAGKSMQGAFTEADQNYLTDMIFGCKLDSFFPIKSYDYTWSNSGSENVKDNTLFKRPTYWLWKNILKRFNLDFHKGLSTDQLRGFFLLLYLFKGQEFYKKLWYKILLGYIIRLGFAPSFMEWGPLKPQAYALFFKAAPKPFNYIFWPLYRICQFCFDFSYYEEIGKVPICESTTNKISLLPTAKLLNLPWFPEEAYIKEVYQEYFKGGAVGESICKGVLSYD